MMSVPRRGGASFLTCSSSRELSTTTTKPKTKPTVVLAGWLGCQPSKLRRYQTFYEDRGYPTLIRIAKPGMVVASAMPNAISPIRWPDLLDFGGEAENNDDADDRDKSRRKLETMQDLAWDVFRALYRRQSFHFLMHSFSNGGCFLHEQVQRILMAAASSSDHDKDHPRRRAIGQFQMVASVHDSCPALDLSRIDAALSYCTEEERDELERSNPTYRSDLGRYLERRQAEYRQFMAEHDPSRPQLYVYSRNDPLVPFEPLDDLVDERRRRARLYRHGQPQRCPTSVVRKLVLDDSPHCAHYLHHRELYESALDSFLAELDGAGERSADPPRGRDADMRSRL